MVGMVALEDPDMEGTVLDRDRDLEGIMVMVGRHHLATMVEWNLRRSTVGIIIRQVLLPWVGCRKGGGGVGAEVGVETGA